MILASNGIIASQITQFVGLLDTYPNAAAAYSLRKLRSAYTGYAIKVRRSSDNTEQDIGFSSSFGLDTSSLTSFCGASNGFITTWYDQSGNGNNATQSTAANQPQIVSGGTVLTLNSKPKIDSSLITDSVSIVRKYIRNFPETSHIVDSVSKNTKKIITCFINCFYKSKNKKVKKKLRNLYPQKYLRKVKESLYFVRPPPHLDRSRHGGDR